MTGRRRSSFFSFLEKGKTVETSDARIKATNNPYLKTMYEQIDILQDTAINISDRIKATDKISYSIYLGGGFIEPSMKNDSQLIDVVIKILMDDSDDAQVKLVIV